MGSRGGSECLEPVTAAVFSAVFDLSVFNFQINTEPILNQIVEKVGPRGRTHQIKM